MQQFSTGSLSCVAYNYSLFNVGQVSRSLKNRFVCNNTVILIRPSLAIKNRQIYVWLIQSNWPNSCQKSIFRHLSNLSPWSTAPTLEAELRVFNRPEFSGRHDFQAKKFGRQCTKSGSHAVGLQEKLSKNLMQNKTYYICVTNAPPT